jgi:hypothetical protein
MKRLCFQLAVIWIAGWTSPRPAEAEQHSNTGQFLGKELLELRSRVRECLSGGCAEDDRVFWVLSRASGTSRIIRALNSRPSWMEEAVHRRVLATLGGLPLPQPRMESDPPELIRLELGGQEGVVALEFATGYPGERLLSVVSPRLQIAEAPELAPEAEQLPDDAPSAGDGWRRDLRSWERPALALVAIAAGLGLLAFLRKGMSGLAERWFARRPLVIPAEAVHQAIYRARSIRELGTNLAECVGRATQCEALFLEFDRSQGLLTEVAFERDGIRTPLSEVGITPGKTLLEIPSLRSAVLSQHDTSSYLAWPLMSESDRPRLLGVLLVLRPSARVRASASVIGTWMERAARFHRSILSPRDSESKHV